MSFERRTFTGGAAATTLTGSMDSSVLLASLNATTGWPTGSVGPFAIVIGRGTATEEKVLVTSRSGAVLTLTSRGIDGTSAMSHAVGDTVEVCLTAVDLDEANGHITDTAYDHHTQYLNTTRHDVEARHTFGAAYGTPAAAADISTAAATGTGNNPAREDHVHKIPAGLVTAAMQNAEAWTAWTPTYSGLTVGSGTVVARSIKRGRDVTLRWSLVCGASTISTAVTLTLPYAQQATGYQTGTATAYDISANQYHQGSILITPLGSAAVLIFGTDPMSASVPFTWANGDIVMVQMTYEAAS